MSAQPVSTSRRPVVVDPIAGLRSVRIEWGISRRALGTHAPVGNAPLITLRYEASPAQDERLTLFDPISEQRAPLPERVTGALGVPNLRSSGGRLHVQSPVLYAFLSTEHPSAPELLYARTPIFEMLGIAGGRYQPLGASIE